MRGHRGYSGNRSTSISLLSFYWNIAQNTALCLKKLPESECRMQTSQTHIAIQAQGLVTVAMSAYSRSPILVISPAKILFPT
jgi:hypothetical protein